MSFLICPECGAENPLEAEICEVCQASLAEVLPTDAPVPAEPENVDFDLFASEESDLPDLLEALKQEELAPDPEGLPEIHLDSAPEEGIPGVDESGGPDPTPKWLDVVRKRAQTEEDAAGDLVRRVSDAQKNLSGEERDNQHEDFETWIQKLRDEARDQAAGEPPSPEEAPLPEDEESAPDEDESEPEWLNRIRKVHGTLEEQEESNAAGRSLLEWLVALEEQQTAGKAPAETEVTQPVALSPEPPPPDATQEVRLNPEQVEMPPVVLELSREAREQADLLSATIADETAERPAEVLSRRKPAGWLHAFLALLLIAGISLMLITGRVVSFRDPEIQPAAQAVLDWATELPEGAAVLLVFDYQPAYAAEVERVAGPVLTEVLASAGAVDVISSSASGPLLSAALLEERVADHPDVTLTTLGYFPGEAYGAYGLAGGFEPDQALAGGDYAGVLILSDQFESAQAWVEQWQALSPEMPLHLLVTAQAGTLLQPYVDAGQVQGMVAGLPEAVAVEATLGQKGAATQVWQAYQVGILILIGGLALGGLTASNGGKRGAA